MRLFSCFLVAILLAGCAPRPVERAVPETRVGAFPPFDYKAASLAGENVYRISGADSHLAILARREGPMARFGHDHVVVAHPEEGYVLIRPMPAESRADVRFMVHDLAVDPAGAREHYKLDTEPSAEDINHTRDNLFDQVLYPDQWPEIRVSTFFKYATAHPESASVMIHATVTIRGVERDYQFPARLHSHGDALIMDASMTLSQTDFGIEPYSALGGMLRVSDTLKVFMHLVAVPLAETQEEKAAESQRPASEKPAWNDQ